MQENYKLKHPIQVGDKVIDEVTIRRLTVGDLYGIKDLNNISVPEIGSLMGGMSGLLEPEVKRMDLEDFAFLSEKVEKQLESFQ